MNSISIIGYGWLGKQLKSAIIKAEFNPIILSRTKLEESRLTYNYYSINDYELNLKAEVIQSKAIVFTIPPSSSPQFVSKLEILLRQLKESNFSGQFIFISSTSVYGNSGEFDEDSKLCPMSENAKKLVEVEQMLNTFKGINGIIVRPGGLIGVNRHPVKFLAGRKDLDGGQDPVNLIHGEDVVRFILCLIEKNAKMASYNLVCPEHPIKQKYYPFVAAQLKLPIPRYKDQESNSAKTVSANKLKGLNFELKYASPFKFPLPLE